VRCKSTYLFPAPPHEFADIRDSTFVLLAKAALLHRFEAGRSVYLQNSSAASHFHIKTGWLKAARTSDRGREQTMRLITAGDLFAVVAVDLEMGRPSDAISLEPLEIWSVSSNVFQAALRQDLDFSTAVIRQLSRRFFLDMVERLSLRSVEARLAHQLLQYATIFVPPGNKLPLRRAGLRIRSLFSRSRNSCQSDSRDDPKRRDDTIPPAQQHLTQTEWAAVAADEQSAEAAYATAVRSE
jgi:CRP-like cAMP-binding protein